MRKRNETGAIHLGIGAWFIISVAAVVFFAGLSPAISYTRTAADIAGKTVGILVSIPGPLVSGFTAARDQVDPQTPQERRRERRQERREQRG